MHPAKVRSTLEREQLFGRALGGSVDLLKCRHALSVGFFERTDQMENILMDGMPVSHGPSRARNNGCQSIP